MARHVMRKQRRGEPESVCCPSGLACCGGTREAEAVSVVQVLIRRQPRSPAWRAAGHVRRSLAMVRIDPVLSREDSHAWRGGEVGRPGGSAR
jgi:hypothetical protein